MEREEREKKYKGRKFDLGQPYESISLIRWYLY